MGKFAINNILKLNELTNEFEFEKASSLYLKLRGGEYSEVRSHLKSLIKNYEGKYWGDELKITDARVDENDKAELLIQKENKFISERKKIIKKKLKELELTQTDLANILGHRKGYMSELINGLRPFSKEDIVILNKILGLKFDVLIPPFLKQEKVVRINSALKSLSSKKKIKQSIAIA